MEDRSGRTRPVSIDLGSTTGLRIRWQDGHESAWGPAWLRSRCPCAGCGIARAKTRFPVLPADVRCEGGEIVGSYALRIRWSDGHDAGIYTFRELRESCLCCAPG